jgi:DNA polymerase-3 subunit gamma/tau
MFTSRQKVTARPAPNGAPVELHRKYRPTRLEDVCAQEAAVEVIKTRLAEGFPHAVAFVGPSGSGKTTSARIVAKLLGCDHKLDYREINAAESRGIDMVRELSVQMLTKPFAKSSCKVYVLDEGHALTREAQSALLKLLEETPDHVYFFIPTTDPNKLIPTVRSRLTEIAFRAIPAEAVRGLIRHVAGKERIELPKGAVNTLADLADGNARSALKLLGQVAGQGDVQARIDALLKRDARRAAFDLVKALVYERPTWGEVALRIKECDIPPEEHEKFRRLVLSVCKTEMLKAEGRSAKAFVVHRTFMYNWFDYPQSGLVAACFDAWNQLQQ